MTLIEIENLTFAQLKSRRDAVISDAKDAPLDDLAARYIQARTDAVQRDEKLAEQGKTITVLQDALASAKATISAEKRRADAAQTSLEAANAMIAKKDEKLQEAVGKATVALADAKQERNTAVGELQEDLRKMREQRDAAVKTAKARRVVLADVINKVSPLLADEG